MAWEGGKTGGAEAAGGGGTVNISVDEKGHRNYYPRDCPQESMPHIP